MRVAADGKKAKKGFTLMEVLIVIAIIAVLAAISIPTIVSALEQSRRAVDMANARGIAAKLVMMANLGDIEIPPDNGMPDAPPTFKGAWVLVTKHGKKPGGYDSLSDTVFFGADPNVTVNGNKHTAEWNKQDDSLAEAIGEFSAIEVKSGGPDVKIDGYGGWDWYVVQVYYDSSTKSYKSLIHSGASGAGSSVGERKGTTAIEEWMERNG